MQGKFRRKYKASKFRRKYRATLEGCTGPCISGRYPPHSYSAVPPLPCHDLVHEDRPPLMMALLLLLLLGGLQDGDQSGGVWPEDAVGLVGLAGDGGLEHRISE